MRTIEADIAIVGSGAGGATVAKELAESGKKIVILEKGWEKGRYRQRRKLHRYFSNTDFLYSELTDIKLLNRDVNVVYWIGTGGTTTVSSANFVRSLDSALQSFGINIDREFTGIEQELGVVPYPKNCLGQGAARLHKAGTSMGLKWEFMPRAVDFDKCRFCGECTLECPKQAKWTAASYIDEAIDKGVRLIENVGVHEILSANGKVKGVRGKTNGEEHEVLADRVVLAAGAVETAVILKNSGIERAGNNLFCHPYYVMYDSSNNRIYGKEPRALINKEFVQSHGFMLANSNVTRFEKFYRRVPKSFKPEAVPAMLGIMVKIKDDSAGKVYGDGKIHKVLTASDTKKAISSASLARDILLEAGVKQADIKLRFFPGVHPGGTAAIGDVVDENLQTEIEHCYVSDASVLPEAPALPPMLTIMALSRRLAERILSTSA